MNRHFDLHDASDDDEQVDVGELSQIGDDDAVDVPAPPHEDDDGVLRPDAAQQAARIGERIQLAEYTEAPVAPPWTVRKWSGRALYKCRKCDFEKFDPAEVLTHAQQKHGYKQ